MNTDYIVSFSYKSESFEYSIINNEWWKFWKRPEIKRLSVFRWERASIPVSEEFVSKFDDCDEVAMYIIEIYIKSKNILDNNVDMVCMEGYTTNPKYIKSSDTLVDYSENLIKNSDPFNKHNWIK